MCVSQAVHERTVHMLCANYQQVHSMQVISSCVCRRDVQDAQNDAPAAVPLPNGADGELLPLYMHAGELQAA